MTTGFNKADSKERLAWALTSITERDIKKRPCVFLSHKREDKPECRKIAKYLENAAIDYYLDEEDLSLQRAATTNDALLVTESIKKGIRNSSHMLVVVSGKTLSSQWVPFEIGYGHAAIIDTLSNQDSLDNKIKLAVLTLKDISEKQLPDFMLTALIIRGTLSLNAYIAEIAGKLEKSLITESLIFSNNKIGHPLDSILNWKL